MDSLGINIVKVFGPEHGFRGNASNGAKVGDEVDSKTGIPIISLYGKNQKPTKEQWSTGSGNTEKLGTRIKSV